MDILTEYRSKFKSSLSSVYKDENKYMIAMADSDIKLTGTILKYKRGERYFQISVDVDAVPSAFIKKTGVEFDQSLLQIIIPDSDNLNDVVKLFGMWIVNMDGFSMINHFISDSDYFQ